MRRRQNGGKGGGVVRGGEKGRGGSEEEVAPILRVNFGLCTVMANCRGIFGLSNSGGIEFDKYPNLLEMI